MIQGAPTGAEVRAELQRVLSSPVFESQERLRKFLSYVVGEVLEERAGELKERTIGAEALGWRVHYDPKVDPIVRVQARRLRDKLDEYYASQPGARLRITLPKGAYVPEFVCVSQPDTSSPPAAAAVFPGTNRALI